VRWMTLGGVGVFIAIVAAIGFYYTLDVTPDEFREGEHYYTLVGGTIDPDAPITVTEFFSYGCIHCRNFDPQIESWAASLPEDVELSRSPVAFNPTWRLYARMYYMAEELGVLDRVHDRLFADVHDRGRTFTDEAQIQAFFVDVGVDEARVERSLRSPVVARKAADAETLARAIGVRSVPTLMVGTKYLIPVGDVGRLQALAIADHLIAEERVARAHPAKESVSRQETDETE
jgi:thiol:disulfide interchange protein DsbA